MTENELYHHGIKGMRWGIRRYQNEDGTLTAAGKRRQAKEFTKKINQLAQTDAVNRIKLHMLQEQDTNLKNQRSMEINKGNMDKAERLANAVLENMAKMKMTVDRINSNADEFNAAKKFLHESKDLVWTTKADSVVLYTTPHYGHAESYFTKNYTRYNIKAKTKNNANKQKYNDLDRKKGYDKGEITRVDRDIYFY